MRCDWGVGLQARTAVKRTAKPAPAQRGSEKHIRQEYTGDAGADLYHERMSTSVDVMPYTRAHLKTRPNCRVPRAEERQLIGLGVERSGVKQDERPYQWEHHREHGPEDAHQCSGRPLACRRNLFGRYIKHSEGGGRDEAGAHEHDKHDERGKPSQDRRLLHQIGLQPWDASGRFA